MIETDTEKQLDLRAVLDQLAPLAISLQMAGKGLPEGSSQRAALDGIGGSLAELGEDLRRLSHDLHPAALERRGLAVALRDHCAEIERRQGLRVALTLKGVGDAFPPETALSLYRIVQEALANTVRHAGARTASVTLRVTANTARLTVTDDGGGFDPDAARRAGGVGLASLEERARLLGGRCRITSAPGDGTRSRPRTPARPADDLDLAGSREAMALLRLKQGRPAETARLLERLAATYEKVYGPWHPELAKTLATLADFYFARERCAEARPLYQRLLALRAAGFGAHPAARPRSRGVRRHSAGKQGRADLQDRQGLRPLHPFRHRRHRRRHHRGRQGLRPGGGHPRRAEGDPAPRPEAPALSNPGGIPQDVPARRLELSRLRRDGGGAATGGVRSSIDPVAVQRRPLLRGAHDVGRQDLRQRGGGRGRARGALHLSSACPRAPDHRAGALYPEDAHRRVRRRSARHQPRGQS